MNDTDHLKALAAERAVEYVRSGMVIGLGHGSTTRFAIRRIGALLRAGHLDDLLGVPCSRQVETLARHEDIPLTTPEEHPVLDLTIDGADEITPTLELIKGGGGALLREKIVAQASRRVVIIVDESKVSPALGTHAPVPVEVLPFGWRTQQQFLAELGADVVLRLTDAGAPFVTDHGNYILDCRFGPLARPTRLAVRLDGRAGIVEHGLFLGLADEVLVAGDKGVRVITGS